jgi:hypothetical protein
MQMRHRLHRLTARFLAISLLAATLFAVDSLASPSPAQARCNGQGNPLKSTFSYGGGVAASDTPGTSTCNGNNTYTGILKDERADGYCVTVWFQETGTPGWIPASGGFRACGVGNTSEFSWTDRNGNSYVYQQFCLERSSTGVDVACGWGTQSAPPSYSGGPYAVNHGY